MTALAVVLLLAGAALPAAAGTALIAAGLAALGWDATRNRKETP